MTKKEMIEEIKRLRRQVETLTQALAARPAIVTVTVPAAPTPIFVPRTIETSPWWQPGTIWCGPLPVATGTTISVDSVATLTTS